MTDAARHLIEAFQALPDLDKREVLAALLREAQVPYQAPSDDDLTSAADEVFLDLDRREAGA